MEEDSGESVVAQFISTEGEEVGPRVNLPLATTPEQLVDLLNELLNNDDELPYTFQVDGNDISTSLSETLQLMGQSTEDVAMITFLPQAVFRVRSVTRCTASIPGHTEAILAVSFSPDGTRLVSASGDTTVRFWDVNTQTPLHTCKGHRNWVLCVAWSPDGRHIASGSMDTDVRVWSPVDFSCRKQLKGHRKHINALAWEPLHLCKGDAECRLASASKDGTVRVWNVLTGRMDFSLSGHSSSVTCLKWTGDGLIVTGSQDRTIKVYVAESGILARTLEGHGHWVNTLALNTEYVLRTGYYDHTGKEYANREEGKIRAKERWLDVKGNRPERLASGSDDFTVFLWEPSVSKKSVARLTGHQQPINLLSFAPDGRQFASASFDKSLKIWDAHAAKFLCTLRGHVGAVYQVCWSSDSRLIVSGSKDSTMKVWDLKTKKIKFDLPGHADEVYAVDWSPDGQMVASGSKDRLLKIWKS